MFSSSTPTVTTRRSRFSVFEIYDVPPERSSISCSRRPMRLGSFRDFRYRARRTGCRTASNSRLERRARGVTESTTPTHSVPWLGPPFSDHSSRFGTNGTEAHSTGPDRRFWAPFDQDRIFRRRLSQQAVARGHPSRCSGDSGWRSRVARSTSGSTGRTSTSFRDRRAVRTSEYTLRGQLSTLSDRPDRGRAARREVLVHRRRVADTLLRPSGRGRTCDRGWQRLRRVP